MITDDADIAGIYEALGRSDIAAALRWGDTPESHADLRDDRDRLQAELGEAEERLRELECLLCRTCQKKWEHT